MKILLLLFTLLPILASAQTIVNDTIFFTEIVLEEVDGHSAYLAYKDSDNEEKYDLVFESEDIFVDGKILFDFDIGLCENFDEAFAKEIIGKAVLLEYYMKESEYFGMQKYAKKLTVLPGVVSSFMSNEETEDSNLEELPFSYYCTSGYANGKSEYNENGVTGICEFDRDGKISKFIGKPSKYGGELIVKYYYSNEGVQVFDKKPNKDFLLTIYFMNGQLMSSHFYNFDEVAREGYPADGSYTEYSADGEIAVTGQYKGGQKNGEWITLSKEYKKKVIENYQNGKRINQSIEDL